MTPIGWINESFVLIDAWQSLTFAKSILDAFAGRWIVVSRRHEEGMKWYAITRLEFEAQVAGQPKETRVEDALGLREVLASEVFVGRGKKESSRSVKMLALNSANRVVLLDSKTGVVKAIGSLRPEAAVIPITGKPIKLLETVARKAAVKKAAAKKAAPRRAGVGYGGVSGEQRPLMAIAGAFRPIRSAANEAYTLVPVYFGTDRNAETLKGKVGFGKDRDPHGEIHLGRCHVAIPARHSMGELESPKWYRLEFRKDPSKHLMLWDTQVLEPLTFYRDVREHARSSPDKDAFVFIHGFNVTFEDAVRRTGQMAHDLSFRGPAILFSWPSRGSVNKYSADEATIESSVKHIQQFLDAVLSRSGAESVHVIAHSMGNRALLGAVQRLATRKEKPAIHNMILAAPDVDKQVFEDIVTEIQGLPKRVTLYASSKDKAIRVSRALHDAPRAGESGKNLIVLPGLDTIDASNVDTDFLGHSYAMDDRFVLADVFELLSKGTAPEKRYGLQKFAAALAGFYWAFRR